MSSDPFARHDIKHLSASSLALYRNEPALWCLRYLFGVKDEVGASAWRGSAVEAGLDWALYRPEDLAIAQEKALARFELDAQGEASDEIEKQRAAVLPCLSQAMEAFKDRPAPDGRQFKIEYRMEGLEVPIIGFVDYTWPDYLDDLKTTLRLPSEPKPSHAAQVAIYHAATGKKPFLTYVTPKKWARYEVTDIEGALWTVTKSAHAVRTLLSMCADKEKAANLFCPNFESFYWSDATKEAAMGVWI